MMLSIQSTRACLQNGLALDKISKDQDQDDMAHAQIPFPLKLYLMLEEAEKQGFDSIVSWLPNNDHAFRVHQVRTFTEQIMPKYFNQTKYKSFQRQLNVYNFSRIVKGGEEQGGYEHKYLVRGEPTLCMYMQRHKIKNTKKVFPSLKNTGTSTAPALGMLKADEILAIRSHSPEMTRSSSSPTSFKKTKQMTAWIDGHEDNVPLIPSFVGIQHIRVEDTTTKEMPLTTFPDNFLRMMTGADFLSRDDSAEMSPADENKYIIVGYQMGLSINHQQEGKEQQ